MKRFIRVIVILLLSFIEVTDIKAQKGLIVYGQNTLCFKTSDILGISHDDLTKNTVSFECKDTIITKQISDIDSISLESLPDCMILKEKIGEWSDMRICKDGTIALSKMRDDGTPTEISMITPKDSLESIFSYIIFDEKEYPVEIIMNDLKIQSFWINDETINLTVVFSDSLSVRYDSLSIVKNDVAKVRRSTRVPNVDEKLWQMRLGGLLEAAGGIGSITVGGIMILGSGAAALFTEGISTPVSLAGILFGMRTVSDGFESLHNGCINAFSPNNYVVAEWDDLLLSIMSQGNTNTLQRSTNFINQLADENGIQYEYERGYVEIPELGAGVANVSYISWLCTIWGQMLSYSARPFTWFDLVRAVYDNVLTGVVVDVSHNSATIRGYIGPYILESPNGKFETEYGIVVNSSSDENTPYKSEPIINGNGGLIEYTFNDLKLDTEYEYCTYYIDKTNGVYVLGKKKTFKTDDLGVETGDVKNIKSTSADVYGQILAVDLSIISKSKYEYGICFTDKSSEEDWIFIPSNNLDSGGFFSVSLSNLKPKTEYTYCAYLELGEDDYLYGEEKTFETEIKSDETNLCPDSNHPHWIDLGLPSGTLWRCCNEGASTPESYGDYHAFGHVSSAPSSNQIKELVNNTSYAWTTINGIDGGKYTGSNGESIFLPAAGSYDEHGNRHDGEGVYQSSTPYDKQDNLSYALVFLQGRTMCIYNSGRIYRLPVRSVRKK